MHEPHTKPELLFWCQREVWHNLNGHPVLQSTLQNYDEKWAEDYLSGDVPVLTEKVLGE